MAEEQGSDYDTLDEDEKQEMRLEARERYLAVAFIMGADKRRYSGLIRDIENNYLTGDNKYPKNVTAAYNLLVKWKGDSTRPRYAASDGVAFTNDGGDGVALATGGRPRNKDVSKIECFNCGEMGHYSSDCPKPNR
jgi:hypothetical protein